MSSSKDLSAQDIVTYHDGRIFDEHTISASSYRQPPIFRLPQELLDEVLRHVIAGHDSFTGRYISLYHVLGVCSLWKDVVEHTPFLWASIHSDMGSRLLNISLARSRYHPLVISWRFRRPSNPEPDDEGRFSTVIQHMHRWGSVQLFDFPPPRSRDLMASQAAPQLKSLRLSSSPNDLRLGHEPFDIADGKIPLLEVLEIYAFPFLWDSGILKGLIELRISYPHTSITTTTQLMRILSQNSRLLTLSFSYLDFHTPSTPESSLTCISLPDLKTLKLYCVPLSFVHTLLRHLHAPCITTLDVSIVAPPHGHSMSRRVARECWLLALPYLRNEPGLEPLTIWVGEGMNVDSVWRKTTSSDFRFCQPTDFFRRGYWDNVSGGFVVRDVVGKLERSWGSESDWKAARKVIVSDRGGVDVEELQRLAPLDAIDFGEADGTVWHYVRD